MCNRCVTAGTTRRCARWSSWSRRVSPGRASTGSAPSWLRTSPNWGPTFGTRPWPSSETSWRASGSTRTRSERPPSSRYADPRSWEPKHVWCSDVRFSEYKGFHLKVLASFYMRNMFRKPTIWIKSVLESNIKPSNLKKVQIFVFLFVFIVFHQWKTHFVQFPVPHLIWFYPGYLQPYQNATLRS